MLAQNIDSVNSGNDCLYHSIRQSLCHTQGNIVDKFSQEIDGLSQPAVLLKDMTTQQMRDAAARTIEWIWESADEGVASIKQVLRSHLDFEAREHLQRIARVQEGAPLQAGSTLLL